MGAPMGPDERAFREDVERGPFLSGVDRGRWRLVAIDWPLADIAVIEQPAVVLKDGQIALDRR